MKKAILNKYALNGYTVNANAPVGSEFIFNSTTIPVGYLIENGAELLKTDYPELYSVVGDKYNSSTTDSLHFCLPTRISTPENNVEYMTGKRHTDGKPIYKKFYALSGYSSGDFIDTITDADKLISNNCIGNKASDYTSSNVDNTAYSCLLVLTSAKKIKLFCTGYTAIHGNIEYTKTSDTSNTPCYNQLTKDNYIIKATEYASLEANAIDDSKTTTDNTWSADKINKRMTYSTDEKVVGTWIDGKPIYRKVVEGTFNCQNAWVNVTPNVSVEYIISTKAMGIVNNTSTGNMSVETMIGNGYFQIYKSQLNFVAKKVVFEYTKTTN